MSKHMGSIALVMLLIMSAGEDANGAEFTMATKWKLQHTAPSYGENYGVDGAKFSSARLFGAFRKALDDDCLDEDCEPNFDIKCKPIGCGPCKYAPGGIKGKCTELKTTDESDDEE